MGLEWMPRDDETKNHGVGGEQFWGGHDAPPCTVTADFHVKLKRPTPLDRPVRVIARAVESEGSWVTVEATMSSDGEVTATCRGRFVAVKPGQPAYHRW